MPDAPSPSGRWAAPSTLHVHHILGATIVPLARETAPGAPLRFRTGVFGADGSPVAAAAHRRGGLVANPPPYAEAEESWDGDFVFAGQLWDHFGHFLLESLARAWAFAALPGPILWQRNAAHARLSGWQQDIFDRLGLGGREHRVVDRPVRIARLAVPEPGLVTRRFLHPMQEAILAAHPYRPPEPGRRVWLSRSGLSAKRAHIDGVDAIEAALADEGWTILRPETLSIADQLQALEAAEVIAGFEGSAFHGLLLGRDVRARIVIFSRGPAINPNYHMIAHAKRLDQQVMTLQLEHLNGRGSYASFRLSHPRQVLDTLRVIAAGPSRREASPGP